MMLTKIIILCLLLCGSAFAQKGVKKSNSEVLKMFGYEKNPNKHKKYPYVQIGDSTKSKGPARIRMSGWDDEVWFEIDLGGSNQLSLGPNFTKSKGKRNGQDSVKIVGNQFYHAMFVTDDGRFEWSAVLEQEPPVSSITFPFTSSGLTFYWQDTLTDEEVAEGAFRPDSVIYSYAIYHSTRSNNYNKADGSTEEYGTGKYGHSYRPKAWDANGDTVWISLLIDTIVHECTISWDSAWMANAIKPVTLDPTVGYATKGGTEDGVNADRAHGQRHTDVVYTAVAGKEVQRMSVWTRVTSGSQTMNLAVYEETVDGSHFRLVSRLTNAETITITNTTADSLHTGNLSVAMTTDSTYGVAWGDFSIQDATIMMYYDIGLFHRDRQLTSDALGVTWEHQSFKDAKFSVWFTYGDAGAPSADISYVRRIKEGEGK